MVVVPASRTNRSLPAVLVTDSLLTMNAFEPLFWMGCVWVLAEYSTPARRLWPWFGARGTWARYEHSTLIFRIRSPRPASDESPT